MQSKLSPTALTEQSLHQETLQLAVQNKSAALSIQHLIGVFMFYMIGTGLGILVYFFEHLISSWLKSRKLKQHRE